MGKQVSGWKDAPLADEPHSNGQEVPKWATAPLHEEVKKKDSTVESPASEDGTIAPGLADSSQPAESSGKPSLESQLEAAEKENRERVQSSNIKVEAGLQSLAPTQLGGTQKGLGQLGGETLRKGITNQIESQFFLSDQNKKLLASIAEAGKQPLIARDMPQPLIKPTKGEMEVNDLEFKDQESKRLREEQKAKEEADNGLGRISSGAGTFDQTVVNTFANVLKSAAIAGSETVGRLGLSGQFGKATDPTQDWAYHLADWVEEKAKEWFPENPAYQGEVLSKTVPEVAGTLFSFMLGGALGKTTKLADLTIPSASKAIMEQTAEHVPAAFMASAATAAEEYDRSLQATGDPETAMHTWERDMFTGLPFLVSPTFRAFNKATDGALKYGIKQFAQGGIAGGFQMATSHALQNLSAQETYDKSREIMDGVLKTGGSGFAINGVLTALLSAISHKAVGASPAEKAKYEEAIKDIQGQMESTKDLGNTDYFTEQNVRTPEGDLGKPLTDVISEAQSEIKSTDDTATIEKKAEEIIKLTPQEGVTNDRENKPGLPGEERVGEEPVKAEPEQSTSPQETGRSGVVQEPSTGQEETLIPEATEGANKPVSDEVIPKEEPVDQTSLTSTDEAGSLPSSEQPTTNETTTESGSNALPDQQEAANVQRVQESNESTQQGVPPESGNPPIPSSDGGPPESGSGIKKALVPEEKVTEMKDRLEQRTNEEFLEQGKKDVESGDINPDALVADVLDRHRALQTHEVAALVYYKAKLDNLFDEVNLRLQKVKAEGGDPGEAAYLKNELQALTDARDKFHEMQLITAREQGRAFGLRKMMLDNEYNLLSQVNQYKAISENGEIPPEVMEHFKAIDEKLKKANERIAELERTAQERGTKETEKAIKETAKKERQPAIKRGKALIDEGLSDLNDILRESASLGIVADSKSEAKRQFNRDQKVIKALSKVGRGLIDEGLATIENVAEKLKEYIQDKFKGIPFENYEKSVVESINAGLPRPTVEDGRLKIPKSVIHDLVESGVDTIEELTTAIHEMVKSKYPDITERQVRDAITQYGKTVNLNPEEIATKVRELKRVGKLISGLEDVRKKLRPLRSGLQRDKLTDKERTMQRELKEAMKELPEDTAETERVWKTTLEATKSRLKNQIADLEEQIATGKKTPKKKGIKYDEEALALQAKRDELRDQLQAIEGQPELSDEQRLRQAVNTAEKSVKDYERRIKEADFEAKQKRAPVTSPELEALKTKQEAAREQLNKVKEELGVADQQRLQRAKEAVNRSRENYERRIKEGDFASKPKQEIVPDKELEKAIMERDKAKFEFDLAQEKNRLANRPMSEKAKDFFIDLFNVPKSLISSLDLSAIFRQGLLLGVAHPSSVPKALGEMVKKMTSTKYNEEWIHKLHQSDIYPDIRNSKLYVAEPHAKLSAREENFVSRLVKSIPGIGSLVTGSERAYTGYLNALRVDVFAKGADALKDAGYTMQNNPQAFKDWASFINNATGRGNLGAFERSAPILNTIFFSPRFLASRLNIMNPATYAKMDPQVRRMAMADALKYITFGTTVLGMAAAAGADVEADPRSTDFGKIKIGNTRYDIWSGFQPIVRVLAQLASGQTKSASGKVNELNSDKFGARTRTDVLGTFLRGKESPTVSSIHNLMSGENVIGEPATPLGELERNVIPLYAQDIASMYQSGGGKQVAQSILPALVGIGVQSYPSTGVEKDSETAKVSADHDYYFSAPSRFSSSFVEPPSQEQYNNFIQLRGEAIQKAFEEHKKTLLKLDNKRYKQHMDYLVRRATERAKSKAGIPEKPKHEDRPEPVEQE